jgi:hypothetical protein
MKRNVDENPVGKLFSEVKNGRTFFNCILDELLRRGPKNCMIDVELRLDTGGRKAMCLWDQDAYAVVRLLKKSNLREWNIDANPSGAVHSLPSPLCTLTVYLHFPESGVFASEVVIYSTGLVWIYGGYETMDENHLAALEKILKSVKPGLRG